MGIIRQGTLKVFEIFSFSASKVAFPGIMTSFPVNGLCINGGWGEVPHISLPLMKTMKNAGRRKTFFAEPATNSGPRMRQV